MSRSALGRDLGLRIRGGVRVAMPVAGWQIGTHALDQIPL